MPTYAVVHYLPVDPHWRVISLEASLAKAQAEADIWRQYLIGKVGYVETNIPEQEACRGRLYSELKAHEIVGEISEFSSTDDNRTNSET
jgi:hypothetical protein